MKVYLDDERPTPVGWIGVSTASAAIALLATGRVTDLSLDHDLGPEDAGTGYEVCKWMEKVAHESGGEFPLPARISVHSANPVGRQRMEAAIRSARCATVETPES